MKKLVGVLLAISIALGILVTGAQDASAATCTLSGRTWSVDGPGSRGTVFGSGSATCDRNYAELNIKVWLQAYTSGTGWVELKGTFAKKTLHNTYTIYKQTSYSNCDVFYSPLTMRVKVHFRAWNAAGDLMQNMTAYPGQNQYNCAL
jgi:hypothetical protein